MADATKDTKAASEASKVVTSAAPQKKATYSQKVPDHVKEYLKEFEIRLHGPGVEEMPSPMVVTALCPMDAFVEVTKSLQIDSTAYSFSIVNGPEDTE